MNSLSLKQAFIFFSNICVFVYPSGWFTEKLVTGMAVSYVHMVQSVRGFHKGNLNCSYKGRRNHRLVFASMHTSEPKVILSVSTN